MKDPTKRKILILGAMREEITPLVRLFGKKVFSAHKGKIIETVAGESTVYFFVTGVGRRNVEKQLCAIEDTIRAVDLVVLVGICGATDKTLNVGNIVIPDKIVSPAGEDIPIDETMRAYVLTNAFQKNIFCTGTLLTEDKLFTLSEKRSVSTSRPDVRIVDMEAYYIGEYLQREHVPFLVVKAVSDGLCFLFPKENFLAEHFNAKGFKKKVKALLCQPIDSIKLLVLKYNIAKAVAINVQYVAAIVKSMV
ncbi:MAG: hypothetical protein KKH94_08495 [Candidatus Omnitrophica bacterium]|nr:hypothetical protein [Candidatus Omnitrophota bacterium]